MTYSKDIRCEALAHGNKKSRYGLRAFLLGILFATVIFLPFIIYDNGLFLYYGDFNVQQIRFISLYMTQYAVVISAGATIPTWGQT